LELLAGHPVEFVTVTFTLKEFPLPGAVKVMLDVP
jgi:hypothetical protein